MVVSCLIRGFFLFFFLFSPFSTIAKAEDTTYLRALQKQAENISLWNDKAWHALVHYHENLIFSGYTSRADDIAFFNANDGKTNPKSELFETLAAFFKPIGEDSSKHPQCLFIARFTWLKEKLDINVRKLPVVDCKRYQEWYEAINPAGLTLVFPSAFPNNPSSAFGHTLIRVDQLGQTDETRSLAYTANYAAHTVGDLAIIYAVKGIFGGYPGYFSNDPYYKKIKQYNDFENRDIWEYELSVTQSEVDMFLMHLWELRKINFDYYYFDENCSYLLLELLDVSKPGLNLRDDFFTWVIPIDTVRSVLSREGYVENITFRPSAASILRERLKRTPDFLYDTALRIVENVKVTEEKEFTELSLEEKANVLDLSYDYYSYKFFSDEDEEESVGRKLSYGLLAKRSELDIISSSVEVPKPKTRPDQGHDTLRVRLGGGYESNLWFSEFGIRPAYHDLLDPPGGFTKGAEIRFFDTSFRIVEENNVSVENFTPLEIFSITPRDKFFKPLSWTVSLKAARKQVQDKDPLVSQLGVAFGFSWEHTSWLQTYTFLESRGDLSGNLEDNFAMGLGPHVGALLDLGDRVGFRVTGKAIRFGLGDDHSEYEISAENRITLSRNVALRFKAQQTQEYQRIVREGGMYLDYYF